MRFSSIAIAVLATLGLGAPSHGQDPGEGGAPPPERRERGEGRRPGGRGEGTPREASNREGRMLREFVRLRLMLRRIRQQEAQLERGRQVLADKAGEDEGAPVLTEHEINLRAELLEIERGRFVEAAKRMSAQALSRIAEAQQKKPEDGESSESAPVNSRLEELRAACERIAAPDSTFDTVSAELDAMAESARSGVPDAALQQRVNRLEGEADSLRERLRAIEEEIMMIRGESPREFWSPPPFGPGQNPPPGGEGMPPPHEMRERGMFDGRTLPPNHPAMRRRDAKPEPSKP